MGSRCRISSCSLPVAARSRFPAGWLAAFFLLASSLGFAGAARAQGNSLFPKGGPNRTLPQATPLPRGALTPHSSDSPASSASSRRRSAPPPRPDTVALPYNLVWFDSQNRLASLFAGVSAKVVEKKPDGPNEIWTVNELIAPNLRTSFFTFQQGMLVGLEFDYGQDAWDTNKYNEVMGQFRRLLETKCESPGEIISRKSDEVPNSTVKETLMGYQWVRGDTIVQLFYYAAEDTAKALNFRSISVHYHYRDPFAPPPGSEPSPTPGAPPPPATGQTASVKVTPTGPDDARGGALPMPDNMPPGSTPAPTAAPSPTAAPAANDAPPAPAATPGTPDGQLPGPEPIETATDTGDAEAAMAPAPSPGPDANPAASPTATPTPKPTPKKSSGRKKKG